MLPETGVGVMDMSEGSAPAIASRAIAVQAGMTQRGISDAANGASGPSARRMCGSGKKARARAYQLRASPAMWMGEDGINDSKIGTARLENMGSTHGNNASRYNLKLTLRQKETEINLRLRNRQPYVEF